MATASPPSPPPASPPPGSSPLAGRARSTPRLTQRLIVAGVLAIVVLIVAFLVFSGGGGADYQLDLRRSRPARAGRPGAGRRGAGRERSRTSSLPLTSRRGSRFTSDSPLTPCTKGPPPRSGCLRWRAWQTATSRLRPVRTTVRRLASGATLPTSATAGSVDLDQLFNIFNPKTRQGLKEVHPGLGRTVRGRGQGPGPVDRILRPVVGRHRPLLRRAGPRSADVHELPRGNREGDHARSARAASAREPGRKRRHAPSKRSALSRRASAPGLRELPVALRQGNRTFVEPSLHVERAQTARGRVQAQHQDARAVLLPPAPAGQRGNSGGEQFQPRVRPARCQQRLHRRDPRFAGARADPVHGLTRRGHRAPGIRADHRRSSAPTRPTSRASSATSVRRPPTTTPTVTTRASARSIADFKVGSGNKLTPASPQQGLEGLKTGQLRRCPGAATQPAADGSSPFTDNEILSCDPSETPWTAVVDLWPPARC